MSGTITQIAELAGVSRGTVDRALHGRGRVNPEVCKRIIGISEALGYRPSKAARHLAIQRQHYKLGFISPVETPMSVWATLMEGVRQAEAELQEYNISIEVRHFQFYFPEEQIPLIDELVEAGVNGLAIVPLNNPAISDKLNGLMERGLPVVTLNTEIEGCRPLAYVGSNYISAGRTAGGLFDLLIREAVLRPVVFYGTKYMMSQHLRVDGLRKEWEALHRTYEIIGPYSITNDAQAAYPIAKQILMNNPECNAVFTVGGSVNSVCQAIFDLKMTGKLIHIGYDISPIVQDYLRNKSMTVAIGQEGARQGYQPLRILADFLMYQVKPQSDHIITHNEIFVQQNCD